MLFAVQLDANGWAFIASAIGVVLMQLYNRHITHSDDVARIAREDRIEADKILREDAAAIRAENRAVVTRDAVAVVASEVKAVKENVVVIEKASNGINKSLVEASKLASELKGAADERARADKALVDAKLIVVEALTQSDVAAATVEVKEKPCP